MLQLPLFEPPTDWRLPDLSNLPSWAGAGRVCIDAETHDEKLTTMGIGVRRGAYTVGWSFTLEDKQGILGPSFYLPFRHGGGDNLPIEQALGYLAQEAKRFTGEVVGASLDYDLDYATEDGILFPNVKYFRDIQIADPLIYELQQSFSLANIGKRVGIEAKDETALINACKEYGIYDKKTKNAWKKHIWKLPARHAAAYAMRDSQSPLEILRIQEKDIEEQGLREAFDQESELLPILVKIRRRGVRIDFDKLEQVETWTRKEQTDALALVKRETGYDIGYENVWKADAIYPALKEIGYPLTRTAKGAWSIENEVLERFAHPVSIAIRHARKVARLRDAFASSIRRYECNGRIHCTYNQIAREDAAGDQKGVRYGRLSAVHLNLQQQPSPDKDPIIAGEWRKIFIPEDGTIWGVLDYAQQEPRWTTHFAALLKFRRAQEVAKRYREDPTLDNHNMMTLLIHGAKACGAMDKQQFKTARNYAKCIFLGLCYGEGGAKLCHDLKLPSRWALFVGRGRSRQTFYFNYEHEAYNARIKHRDGFYLEVAGAEGAAIIEKFNEEVPYVSQIAKKATQQAKKNGYIKTIMGRRMHFPMKDDGSYDWTHKALNRLIQATSAEQTKQAVIDTYKAGYYIQIQVHDELDGSFSSEKEAREAGDIMAVALGSELVPQRVDVETGPSWGEAA